MNQQRRSILVDSLRSRNSERRPVESSYKWVALSNTTIAVLLATIDSSIMLIALPAIFRGIHLDPLSPANSFYLLWMILGFLIVSSVLVVGLGRLGDIYGRVRMYNLGFLIFTVASLALALDPFTRQPGALWLIVGRIVQGVGAAFLMANSAAILTDAFPPDQRGLALGINNVAGISGSFIGLVLGGLLASIDWRLVFLVPIPFSLFGTVWSYLKLREIAPAHPAPIDWIGNLAFSCALVLLMLGITAGIEPADGHVMGWTSEPVLLMLGSGFGALVAFFLYERVAKYPMFRLTLFRIRSFTYGTLSTFLSSMGRGGLMFMLVIWLQGLWLPLHHYHYASTPLWAGILILPLTAGFLISGPIAGRLSDRHGARYYATVGMLMTSLTFVLLLFLPIDFHYPQFAILLFLSGLAMGAFAAPNRAAVMNSLPPEERGAGGGMNTTFQNAAQVLSIGIFFSLVIAGLARPLQRELARSLIHNGVPAAAATKIARLPPVAVLFSAFLGVNPIRTLLGPRVLSRLPRATQQHLLAQNFFPHLISRPFRDGLTVAFIFGALVSLIAALASWSRGTRYVHSDAPKQPSTLRHNQQKSETPPINEPGDPF